MRINVVGFFLASFMLEIATATKEDERAATCLLYTTENEAVKKMVKTCESLIPEAQFKEWDKCKMKHLSGNKDDELAFKEMCAETPTEIGKSLWYCMKSKEDKSQKTSKTDESTKQEIEQCYGEAFNLLFQ
ncbi:uncharacterized protein LOC106464138 [Limulus polyphemus]|uniref:Uncharacterized protein LOC106464138 n=1 Tax=Limulus polyphemus TaxID=6850 RepID=A0ABM1BDC2_LIMPO|nr:uncharacterized protein LOC106464138 [Limulus polyphemus]